MSQPAGPKIGVLTFHRCINYGSYWQARCLVEELLLRGYNATIIDHESGRINLAEWKCAYQPTLPTAVSASDFPLYRNKISRFFQAFESLPLSPRFPIDRPQEMESYDTVIVGSDEVWNLFHPWYGECPLFYGEGIRADQIISYAASFGNYPAMRGLDETWATKLYNFEAISVRDDNSYSIVKNAIGVEPEIVLDPCLQFPVDLTPQTYALLQEPYLALYGHNFSDYFMKEVRRHAKLKQLRIISIGYRNDWADEQWIDAGPEDFTHFIAQAEAVATNFFHGCVFAIRHQKPFVCESSPYRSHKVNGLMMKLGGQSHLVTENTSPRHFNKVLSEPVCATIFQNIEWYRQRSNNFLATAMDLQQRKIA